MKILKKVLIAVLLITACVVLFFMCTGKNKSSVDDKILLADSYEREAYLNLKGWEVTPVSEDETVIPEIFNDVYKEYAQLQKKQKLPLENFRGKNSTRFLYNVENYGGTYPVYAELLIVDNQLVAAALIEQRPDGFIKELY